jgi:tetratricopeptide (TPR) repeat protein
MDGFRWVNVDRSDLFMPGLRIDPSMHRDMDRPGPANGARSFALGGMVFAVALAVYWLSGMVFISHPDPTNEKESPNPGIQDQFVGLDCFSVNDSSAVITQSLSLINDGNLTVDLLEAHRMFEWSIAGLEAAGSFTLPAIDGRLQDWIEAGTLRPARRYPQIVETTTPGEYLNCFGVGGALAAAPGFALAQWIYGPLADRPDQLDRWAFGQGAIMVALSAALLAMAWSRWVSVPATLWLAIGYAFGTCVYSTSSQGMWQHSATALFLASAIFLLTRPKSVVSDAYWIGAAMAMATLSRPTLGIAAVALGAQWLWTDRPRFIRYAIAGLPFAAFLLACNNAFFGAPLQFGQTVLVDHAFEKTGVAKIWQTPTLVGLSGLLLSPSRGLFVFSPFLLFTGVGIYRCWRENSWIWMRWMSVAVAGMILVEAHHFDWWGGWSYSYRHLVDLSPMLVTLILPVIDDVRRDVRWRGIFAGTLLLSVAMQIVGVTANDVWRWNAKALFVLQDAQGQAVKRTTSYADVERWLAQPGHRFETLVQNVDRLPYRHRLWEWSEQPALYYAAHFRQGTLSRQAQMWNARQPFARKLATSYRQIASTYAKASAFSQAKAAIEWGLAADPAYQEGWLTAWEILVRADRQIDPYIALLRRQTILDPDDDAAGIFLGLAYAERGNLLEASDALGDVIRRHPKEFERRYQLAREVMDRRVRDLPLARPPALVQADLGILDQAVSAQVEGRVAELRGDWTRAADSFQKLRRPFPSATSTQAHQARLRFEQNDPSGAWSILRADPSGGSP